MKQKTWDSREGSLTLQLKFSTWLCHCSEESQLSLAVAHDPKELLAFPFLSLLILISFSHLISVLQEGFAVGEPIKEESVLGRITEGSLVPSLAANIQKSGASRVWCLEKIQEPHSLDDQTLWGPAINT